jgi:hypothetical protein
MAEYSFIQPDFILARTRVDINDYKEGVPENTLSPLIEDESPLAVGQASTTQPPALTLPGLSLTQHQPQPSLLGGTINLLQIKLPLLNIASAIGCSDVPARLGPKDLALAGHKAALAQQNHRPCQKPRGGPASAWPGYGPGLLYGREILREGKQHKLKGKIHCNSLALLILIQTITTLRIETSLSSHFTQSHRQPHTTRVKHQPKDEKEDK